MAVYTLIVISNFIRISMIGHLWLVLYKNSITLLHKKSFLLYIIGEFRCDLSSFYTINYSLLVFCQQNTVELSVMLSCWDKPAPFFGTCYGVDGEPSLYLYSPSYRVNGMFSSHKIRKKEFTGNICWILCSWLHNNR